MNLPNKLTILRICMIPAVVALAYFPAYGFQLAAAAVFGLAALTDLLDGKIARRKKMVTNFGKFADPIADKLLVTAALIVLVGQGRVPAWDCIVILAREFIISGFRLIAVENGRVIAAGKLGKLKTVAQIIAILLLLLLTPAAEGGLALLGEAGIIIADVALYICLALTVLSGAEYIIQNIDCIRDM